MTYAEMFYEMSKSIYWSGGYPLDNAMKVYSFVQMVYTASGNGESPDYFNGSSTYRFEDGSSLNISIDAVLCMNVEVIQ